MSMNTRSRLEVVYMALQRLRSREIMRRVSTNDFTEYGDDNALLKELAKILDAALRTEVDRRRSKGTKEGAT